MLRVGDPFGGPHNKKERKPLQIKDFRFTVAERTRFELAVELPLRQFSKLLVSATHPPLRKLAESISSIATAKVALFFIPASVFADFFKKRFLLLMGWEGASLLKSRSATEVTCPCRAPVLVNDHWTNRDSSCSSSRPWSVAASCG